VFTPPDTELAKDHFELQVSFGGWTYAQFFDPRATNYGDPLPRTPPPVGERCLCPSCVSEGWYASSPACRFWRAFCDLCQGCRSYVDPALRIRVDCEACQDAWTTDVRFFRDALRSPAAVVRRLRTEAAAAARHVA
jgi:hypothetical protein